MSDIVIKTLRNELKKKQARIMKLETLMTEKHILRETAQAMDGFAKRFNSAPTSREKLQIADEWKATGELWKKQCAKAREQTKNYMKWMDEQSKLETEARHLGEEIGMKELRESLRGRPKVQETTRKEKG